MRGEYGTKPFRSKYSARYKRNKLRVTKLSPFEDYLRERQAAAHPAWIPATVLQREMAAQGYAGGLSQLRAFLRSLKPALPIEPVVRFETTPGEQMQVDWVEFRKGKNPLYAFCATLGFSRMSFVEFVTDMKVQTLIACHDHAFEYFRGVPRKVLYDNMKTVVLERDAAGEDAHRFHSGFLDYARHCGFIIKLCRPYRAKTKGKVERFNGYLRVSFYVPLVVATQAGRADLGCNDCQYPSTALAKRHCQSTHPWPTQVRPAEQLKEECLQKMRCSLPGTSVPRPRAHEPHARQRADDRHRAYSAGGGRRNIS